MRKIEKRLHSLESSNSALFFSNEALRKEFKSIKFDVIKLEAKKESLEKEQSTYENSLRAEIERIQALKPWKRFWGSVELFRNIFEVIQDGFKNEE